MRYRMLTLFAVVPLAAACASSFPEPKQPLADDEAASRSADELGAGSQPAAKLHETLANEQIGKAKTLIGAGNNERATFVILRARADAELAIALAHEQHAAVDVQSTVAKTTAALNTSTQGATQ